MALVRADVLICVNTRLARFFPRGVLIGIAAAIKLTPALFIVHCVATRQWRVALWSALGALAALGQWTTPFSRPLAGTRRHRRRDYGRRSTVTLWIVFAFRVPGPGLGYFPLEYRPYLAPLAVLARKCLLFASIAVILTQHFSARAGQDWAVTEASRATPSRAYRVTAAVKTAVSPYFFTRSQVNAGGHGGSGERALRSTSTRESAER